MIWQDPTVAEKDVKYSMSYELNSKHDNQLTRRILGVCKTCQIPDVFSNDLVVYSPVLDRQVLHWLRHSPFSRINIAVQVMQGKVSKS